MKSPNSLENDAEFLFYAAYNRVVNGKSHLTIFIKFEADLKYLCAIVTNQASFARKICASWKNKQKNIVMFSTACMIVILNYKLIIHEFDVLKSPKLHMVFKTVVYHSKSSAEFLQVISEYSLSLFSISNEVNCGSSFV